VVAVIPFEVMPISKVLNSMHGFTKFSQYFSGLGVVVSTRIFCFKNYTYLMGSPVLTDINRTAFGTESSLKASILNQVKIWAKMLTEKDLRHSRSLID